MVVGNIGLVDPVGNFILMVILDIAPKTHACVEKSRAATLLAALVEICLAGTRSGKALENEETGQA